MTSDAPSETPPGAATDERLVERAQAGDVAAFEQLVHRHADQLRAVLLRFTGSPQEAEEAAQEAFLRAWRSIGRFEARSKFFTWLYRIGINEAKRRAGRRPVPGSSASIDADPALEIADRRPGPSAEAEHRELEQALDAAIRDLEPDYRVPLILRDIEGLDTRAAAETMELSEAAFKSRLHRARRRVRDAVADLLDDAPDDPEPDPTSPGPSDGHPR
ncbi:MAG: RNA polymerase sigma factor [Solirubrobacterales bacterium]